MNYNKLFDTLYSESISEDVKELVVEKVLDEAVMKDVDFLEESIHESNSKVSAYQEALSYLVNSNISEEVMMETLDLMFANESEEVIGQVEEAFKEDVAKGILVSTLLEDFTETHNPLYKKHKELEGADYYRKRTPIEKAKLATQSKAKELGSKIASGAKAAGSKIASSAKAALGKLKDTVGKVFSKKESKSTDIGKGDGSFRSKEPAKVEMNKGTGEFRGKSKGPAPVGLAALRRAHGEEPISRKGLHLGYVKSPSINKQENAQTQSTVKPLNKIISLGDRVQAKKAWRRHKVKLEKQQKTKAKKNVSPSNPQADYLKAVQQSIGDTPETSNKNNTQKGNKQLSTVAKTPSRQSSSHTSSKEGKNNPEQQTLLNKNDYNQGSRVSSEVEKRIAELRSKLQELEKVESPTPSQKGQKTKLINQISRLSATNESLARLPELLGISESLIHGVLEMLRPNKETYKKLLNKDAEKANRMAPVVYGQAGTSNSFVVEPQNPLTPEEQNEIATHHEKVQARKAKYNK